MGQPRRLAVVRHQQLEAHALPGLVDERARAVDPRDDRVERCDALALEACERAGIAAAACEREVEIDRVHCRQRAIEVGVGGALGQAARELGEEPRQRHRRGHTRGPGLGDRARELVEPRRQLPTLRLVGIAQPRREEGLARCRRHRRCRLALRHERHRITMAARA
ncbi:MAG: hypothetical protein U0168_25815 [Nannocystaceae bacterium]